MEATAVQDRIDPETGEILEDQNKVVDMITSPQQLKMFDGYEVMVNVFKVKASEPRLDIHGPVKIRKSFVALAVVDVVGVKVADKENGMNRIHDMEIRELSALTDNALILNGFQADMVKSRQKLDAFMEYVKEHDMGLYMDALEATDETMKEMVEA